ncbi:MAG: hypothetical protein JO131_06215 [Gammaproteobacteria bacterium]|nr:hypothetical protein [Gammaproteobacteria bacterium]
MYQSTSYSLKRSNGITLIELLFAMALTLLICSNVSTIYLANVKNHLAEAALQNTQQNARITFQLLNGILHSVGYMGCAKLTDDFPIAFSTPYTFTQANKIQPYYGNELKPGTNAFTVRYVNNLGNTLIDTMSDTNILHVNNFIKIAIGDVLLISDCKSVDIFVVEHISIQGQTQIVTSDRKLSKRYEKNAEVSPFNIYTFYIGKTDRKDPRGYPVYALYEKDQFSHKNELVEGVNDMQIRYTTKENNIILEKNADLITDWTSVIGVSLQVIFSSLNYFPLQKTKYAYIAFRE